YGRIRRHRFVWRISGRRLRRGRGRRRGTRWIVCIHWFNAISTGEQYRIRRRRTWLRRRWRRSTQGAGQKICPQEGREEKELRAKIHSQPSNCAQRGCGQSSRQEAGRKKSP